MPELITLRPIRLGDYQRRVRTALPNFTVSHIEASSSGYGYYTGIYEYYPLELSSSSYPINVFDGSYQPLIWKSLNQLYYNEPYAYGRTYEHTNSNRTQKLLFYSASVISIPHLKMGYGVLPNSVQFTGTTSQGSYTLNDDRYGNLRDSNIDTGSFAPSANLLGYWSFNDEYRNTKYLSSGIPIKSELKYSSNVFYPERNAILNSIIYDTTLKTTGTYQNSLGIVANFSDTGSYMLTPNEEAFKQANSRDFAWSFWLKLSGTDTSSDYNYVISKRGVETVTELNRSTGVIETNRKNIFRNRYPYSINIDTASDEIHCQRSDGTFVSTISSSISINDNLYRHIVYQKTGSEMQLYIDGVIEASGSDNTLNQTYNNSDIMFGCLDMTGTGSFSGSLAEVRLYNTALTSENIASLANRHYISGSMLQTNIVGNVFYRTGNVVVSSPNLKYGNINNITWSLSYTGQHDITEHEILIRVPKDNMNMTLNPTILENPDSDLISGEFRSGSLAPYITTIGMYNEKNEMVAVAKLGQAIQKRDDIDMNFIVRFDT